MLFLLGFVALIIAVLGPVPLGLFAGRIASRARYGWAIHVAFLPGLLVAQWMLWRLIAFAYGDTGDDTPGLGLAMLPAAASTLITIVGYYIWLSCTAIQRRFFSDQTKS